MCLKMPESSQIHLGHGITMPEGPFSYAVGEARTPGRFVRLISRGLWEPAELFNRSVTGQACRRLLKKGAVRKAPLTPEKIDALTGEYTIFLYITFPTELLKTCEEVAI